MIKATLQMQLDKCKVTNVMGQLQCDKCNAINIKQQMSTSFYRFSFILNGVPYRNFTEGCKMYVK